MKVKVFADGADKPEMVRLAADPLIAGFTTNPTLMKQSGVPDYEPFAREVLEVVTDKPISFEVFSDELPDMERQARKISVLGRQRLREDPGHDDARAPTDQLVRILSADGINVNVTALMTVAQVERVATSLVESAGAYVSVFAGRIADAGVDPVPTMQTALEISGLIPRSS